ncbi:MAG: hypothetical protein Q4G34_02705 [Micrococcus sp.]|nr:hypothetical protein [Micrococcus sp.]
MEVMVGGSAVMVVGTVMVCRALDVDRPVLAGLRVGLFTCFLLTGALSVFARNDDWIYSLVFLVAWIASMIASALVRVTPAGSDRTFS